MFGTLRIKRCGLTTADRELYQAQFCAGCHALREFGGRPLSLLTNYDQAFLVLVYSAMEAAMRPVEVETRPCTALPFHGVPVQSLSLRGRRTVAALTVALVCAKLRDDAADEGGVVRRSAARLLAGRGRRAMAWLDEDGFPVEALASLSERQALAERDTAPTLSSLSAPTATALAEIFAWIAVTTEHLDHGPALRRLGEALGRFVYVWDAVRDRERDARSGSFNALTAVFGANSATFAVRAFLSVQLKEMADAMDALPLGERKRLALHQVRSLEKSVAQRLPTNRRKSLQTRTIVNRRLQSQRGDCDCGCGDCCCSDHCCCSDGCCGSEDGCCGHSSCCDCCDGCDCCPCDWCGGDSSGRRKRKRPQP